MRDTLYIRLGGATTELTAAAVCELLEDLKPDSILRRRLEDQAGRMLNESAFTKPAAYALERTLGSLRT